MADFDDSDNIAPLEDSASASHGGDWSRGSDEEGDLPSSPSEYASPLLSSNDASRLKPATVSTRTPAQSKPSASTHSSKDEIEKPKAVKKDGDAGPTKHKQPSRRSSGYQNSSSSPHDDRLKMSFNPRSSYSRSSRRNDEREPTLADIFTVVRTMAVDLSETRATVVRLEAELKEYKTLSIQNQGEILRVCQAWDDRDGQYAAHGEADHSDEASQYTDESIPQDGAGSSDTAYDGSRDVSKAPADERPPARDAETPDQEMVAFEDDDHKSVNPIHDDEREPARKRQRVETTNDQPNGTQTNGWVPRYTSQQVAPMICVSYAHI
ncbi:hypothetical protein PENSPDRAFT_328961 [Peniophora sp. CONT]|nr:hypothetical protein PENSPDRAFT_328961 [Peniophora sp. CONT]